MEILEKLWNFWINPGTSGEIIELLDTFWNFWRNSGLSEEILELLAKFWDFWINSGTSGEIQVSPASVDRYITCIANLTGRHPWTRTVWAGAARAARNDQAEVRARPMRAWVSQRCVVLVLMVNCEIPNICNQGLTPNCIIQTVQEQETPYL